MRTSNLLLIAVLTVVAVVYPVAMSAQQPWHPIEGEDLQSLGGWAVTEHVKQAHDGLKFSKVFSGEKQQLSTGEKYHLVIIALNGSGKTGRYDVVLIEGKTARKLISFTPAK
ncbi:cysteine proteinase inhibitor 8 [Brachypodium distachyon]|uniref:Cystatin domain-containing protein n=1 Tax=Brachypodium distachyon TaxID=15368 RepID=A0A0Q3HJ29_BRADI|nr:cysteine proteinase inhibitor 8 [Brachypodium distachyon]KQK22991.1 hypothetical protein BRADI_1g70526v3 [Brachypodium distachyon]|eukprot:XP_010230218.1 cysteine proteinase inhibitor 8 [Brachypodium distachyon]